MGIECSPRERQVARGNDKAERFMQHLEPLQGALASFCRRSLYDHNSMADVLQSAIGNAFRDFDRYAEGSNFRAWIFRYVHFEILNCNRKHERTGHLELPAELSVDDVWEFAVSEPLCLALIETPEKVLDRCDQELATAILALPPLERAVFLLRAIGHFKYREMADILEIPIGTVMSCLALARVRLRKELAQHAFANGWLKPEDAHHELP
jgi:RNA polymerase sigma-70 factor (ECF subfamily)